MFHVFDGLMLVLDNSGRILEYKAGQGPQLDNSIPKRIPENFRDIVPADAWQKYEKALLELGNGSSVVLFEYMLSFPAGKFWYESRLIPFTNDRNIMFIRDITEDKLPSSGELTFAYDKTIESWSQALSLREQEKEDHIRRVTDMACNLARRLNLSETDLVLIERGALLHDIGKVAIPDSILLKPGPLTEEEWAVMRQHPVIASEIMNPIQYLAAMQSIPRSHHEKWDGSGYPDGLAGKSIPLYARIFAFADVYDALTSERPYRRAWPQADAVAHIAEQSGKHFDPSITPVFIGMLSEA